MLQISIYFRIIIIIMNYCVSAAYSPALQTAIRNKTILDPSYDNVSRPDDETIIKIGIGLLAIDYLDLENQIFAAIGWLYLEWQDSRLVWTPSDYGNSEYIFAKPGEIWQPELVIDNEVDNLGVITADLSLRVRHDGLVEWKQAMHFLTQCQVDITFYPYDQQKCSVTVANWGYVKQEVTMKALLKDFDIDNFQTDGEWIITSMKAALAINSNVKEDGTIREYSQIAFWIYLRRRTMFYDLNFIFPITLTSFLVAITFIVPVESGEKLTYILTIFLSLTWLLSSITNSVLPQVSLTVCILGLYLNIILAFSAFGIFLTLIVLNLNHKSGKPNPTSAIFALTRFAARVTCYSGIPLLLEKRSKNKVTFVNDSNNTKDITWGTVATVIDRFFFFIFLTITIFINIFFITYLVIGGRNTSP